MADNQHVYARRIKTLRSLQKDPRPTAYLYALFDPEMAAHGLPVLRAADVQ